MAIQRFNFFKASKQVLIWGLVATAEPSPVLNWMIAFCRDFMQFKLITFVKIFDFDDKQKTQIN